MTPTRRSGWFGITAVAVGSFGTVLSEFLPIGLLPSISTDLGVSIGTAGLMVVVTGLAAAVAAPVVTVATSRLDRRTVLIGLSAVLVVADVAALAGAFPVLLLARTLLGVSLGGFWAVGSGIAPRLVDAADTIRATSLITAGISIATVVSLPLGAFVAATSTWRLAFVIGAVLGAIALVLQLVALPAIPSQQRIRPAALMALFGVPRARVGLAVAALLFAAQFAAYTFISPFLQDTARISPEVVSVALLVFGTAGIVGNFVASATLARSVATSLVAGGLVLAAAVALLPLVAHLPVAVFGLLIVWGLVWGGLPLGLQTWMVSATPEGAEAGLAMFVTTIQIALAIGSTIGGVVVTLSGIPADFESAAILALLGTGVLVAVGLPAVRMRVAVAHH